jgi:hypothetical protein
MSLKTWHTTHQAECSDLKIQAFKWPKLEAWLGVGALLIKLLILLPAETMAFLEIPYM